MIESSQATVFHRGRRRSGFRALRSARPPDGARTLTVSPLCAFTSALATGDTQLTWPRLRSASSMPTMTAKPEEVRRLPALIPWRPWSRWSVSSKGTLDQLFR
jgi:hypothetical protein